MSIHGNSHEEDTLASCSNRPSVESDKSCQEYSTRAKESAVVLDMNGFIPGYDYIHGKVW